MRNALRETFKKLGLACNRERLNDEDQLAVKFSDYPDPEKYIDDFFMGWLIAAGKADREKIKKEISEKGRDPDKFTFKRDSVLRMNMALALEPYRYNSVFTQSPQNVDSPWKNAENSQLLHRETVHTAYQYPFALNLNDCLVKQEWTKKLLKSIGQLNNVAGNHARSYFEMAPASILVRLTSQLVAGYDNYGFQIKDGKHLFPEVIEGILKEDYPGSEFYVGGRIIKDMDDNTLTVLRNRGVNMDRNPQDLLTTVADNAFS